MDPQKRKVDKYTRKTRQQREGGPYVPPLLHRMRNGIEGANRKLWYGLLRMILRNEPVAKKIPIEDLESIMIIPYGSAIGDILVSFPVASVIKKRNPNCKVGIITSHRNDSILRCDPNFDDQYQFTGRSDRANFKNLRRARAKKYQVVLNIHFQRMSDYGLISNYISPAGVKVSVQHKRGEMYRILFNHLSDVTRFRVHLSQLSLKLLDDVIDFSSAPLRLSESRPTVTICPRVFESVKDKVEELLSLSGAKWFIYVNPQARNASREWGIENNLAFCDAILDRYPDGAVLMTSAPIAQEDLVAEIAKHQNERIHFFETSYDLNELASLCRLSRLIVTPDTSVVHLASAESKACIVFYPEHAETPREWLPLMVPSYQFGISEAGRSVTEIPVADVVTAAINLIEGTMLNTGTSTGLDPETPSAFQASHGDELLIDVITPMISHGVH